MQQTSPELLSTVAQVRHAVARARGQGKRVGLVPTMGALHEGHLSLCRASQAECGYTLVSIYVNPTQFGPRDDFSRYPRTLPDDLAALATCNVAGAFVPADEEMYPPGFATWVDNESVARPLEGQCRPGHFRGVATVVLKLLNMVGPDVAYFGQKDYQQALLIRRMVDDLNVSVTIRVCPTVREEDGLAMSSRNRYLDADARRRALVLSQSLDLAQRLVDAGECRASVIAARMREVIQSAPEAQIEYIALADPETLDPLETIDRPAVALLAVRIGGTRLIDNRLLK